MPRCRSPRDRGPRRARVVGGVLLVVLSLAAPGTAIAANPAIAADRAVTGPSAPAAVDLSSLDWVWPAERFRLTRAYVAPAHEYGPGHRGIDLDLLGGLSVRAPADGVVAFAGRVAGRGILTIDHGGGLVTTLEPVETTLSPGTPVDRGEEVAALSVGGHAVSGQLHFGVRLNGAYVNPMLLLGGVPRAVLLPCCD